MLQGGKNIEESSRSQSIILVSKKVQSNKMDSLRLPSKAKMAAKRTACKVK